jgi:hypothetical protein
VTIRWQDRSTNEQQFVVYKRDVEGAWRGFYAVPTSSPSGVSGDYQVVDIDHSVSGQCYMIAAVGASGTTSSPEACTVRPDPGRFPQAPPPATQQWSGLSSVNDGPGSLRSNARPSESDELTNANQTWGVDLDWTEFPALWKAEAKGGPHLMQGQAVALRVWGGGWLKYADKTYGTDVELSSTPSYEWYPTAGAPGTPLGGDYALWNDAAHDYLVADDHFLGVGLEWYQNTLPVTPTPPTPQPGVKTLAEYNCISEARPLEIWVSDLSAGGGWTDKGRLESQWSGGGCPGSAQPWTFSPPVSGHVYQVRSVDLLAPRCQNDPTRGGCWRSDTTFTSDTNGQVVVIVIA